MSSKVRSGLLVALVCAFMPCQRSVAADLLLDFDLEPQPLASALARVSNLANLNLLFDPNDLAGRKAPRLKGNLDAEQALSQILVGTGLHLVRVNEHTLTIVRDSPSADFHLSRRPNLIYARNPVEVTESGNAVSDAGTNSSGEPDSGGGGDSGGHRDNIQEVLVTAQKRTERIQDVPVPVTVLNAQTLLDVNQTRLQDYASTVPGLNLSESGFGHTTLFIRGVTTGINTNPTVAITVDDVPFGSSTYTGGGVILPDLDPSVLQQVEVLRGPQGTLYGANGIGGLLKFITSDPSTSEISGRLQADANTIYNAGGAGFSVRGSVNVPLTDTWAVRASAFVRKDPGFLDNIQTGERGVARQDGKGGMLSALWHPSDDLSLKLNALIQDSSRYGWPKINIGPGFGDLEQSVLAKTGGFDSKYQSYSAVLKAKMGAFDLTSISSYSINAVYDSIDFGYAFSGYTQFGDPSTGFNGFGVPGAPLTQESRTNKFSQEVRLNTAFGRYADWLFGVFYTLENSPHLEIDTATTETGQVVGIVGTFSFPSKYEEYAAFTDVTLHITDRFNLQLGGREGHNKQLFNETDTGPYVASYEDPSGTYNYPRVATGDSAFTYLVTPQYKINPDMMVYGRIASGYRPGGPNTATTFITVPRHYAPDKTVNYEVGFKGDLLDNRLSFDGSVYYIDWKDIQIFLIDYTTYTGYYSNGSRAKSEGAELSLQFRPVDGLSLGSWVAWNNAQFTRDLPSDSSVVGGSGTRLPYSPKFSANFSIDEAFPVTDELHGFVGAAVTYIGDRSGAFTTDPTVERTDIPAYAKTDVHLGLKYADWTATLYGNNVTDRRGYIDNVPPAPNQVAIIQPRTIGLSVSRRF